jgi:Cu(I)/Ag(I) efflux system membrane fusion protein
MHSQIVRDEPGNCPICGMNLVPKRIDGPADGHPTVTVRGEIVQSLGVRTAKAGRGTLWKFVQTVGRVAYDETALAHLHPRAEGWMERLFVRAEGDPVEAGQALGEVYSPEILAAQVDYLVASDTGTNARDRIEKARNRLRLLGVTEATISAIEKSRETTNTVPMVAPRRGILTRLGAREGMYVTPATEVFTIADLSRVWVLVDVFEHQIDWIRPGATADIRLPAYPGRTWEGQVDYLYPELDAKSRTLRVRLIFDNPDGLLKPNMFAEVNIYGGPRNDVLVVPREAVIITGERETVVKALGEGRFQPVDVVTGMRQGDSVEIVSGLAEGDEVVVSGQFLIDSESSLQASFLRMAGDSGEPAAANANAHNH